MIRITHTSSLAVYKAVFKLRKRDGFFSRNWLALLIYPTVLVALGLIFARHNYSVVVVCFHLAPLLITFWVLTPAFRFYEVRDAYRNSRRGLDASQEFTMETDSDQIVSGTPGLRRFAYDWASVLAFAQNESVTVFRMTGHHLVFFPTPCLTPEQRAELDELVSRHGIRRWS
jgi:hypothetical protein